MGVGVGGLMVQGVGLRITTCVSRSCPKHYTLNHQPSTLHPNPETLNCSVSDMTCVSVTTTPTRTSACGTRPMVYIYIYTARPSTGFVTTTSSDGPCDQSLYKYTRPGPMEETKKRRGDSSGAGPETRGKHRRGTPPIFLGASAISEAQ